MVILSIILSLKSYTRPSISSFFLWKSIELSLESSLELFKNLLSFSLISSTNGIGLSLWLLGLLVKLKVTAPDNIDCFLFCKALLRFYLSSFILFCYSFRIYYYSYFIYSFLPYYTSILLFWSEINLLFCRDDLIC